MTTVGPLSARDFLAAHRRGGGLFTDAVSQRAGAWFALLAHRRGVAPTVLTLTNLGLGLAAAALVAVGWGAVGWGAGSPVVLGLAALLLWQVAYALDCADGQLARVTGQASPAGKRVDILCDVALQVALVAAIATVAAEYQPAPSPWLVAAFAGTWLVNLVTSTLQQGDTAASLLPASSPAVRAVKLIRDYGFVVTLVGLVLAFVPEWTIWLIVLFTTVNGLFLGASIAAAARASVRSPEPS